MASLSKIKSTDLGGIVISGVLQKNKIQPNQVDEVILGNVCQAGLG